jgi:RNA polymerase-binding transcription factor DksA
LTATSFKPTNLPPETWGHRKGNIMARKPYKHNDLSNRKCKECGKPLKLNLLAKAPHADICHTCKKAERIYDIDSKANDNTSQKENWACGSSSE